MVRKEREREMYIAPCLIVRACMIHSFIISTSVPGLAAIVQERKRYVVLPWQCVYLVL